MHRMTTTALSIVFLLSTPASLVAASSQTPQLLAQAAPTTEPAAPGAAPAAGQPAQRGSPTARVEFRISDLHRKLHITSEQEPQFKAFADVMRANAKSMQDMFEERAKHRDRTAPGILHWYAQLSTAHGEGLNKLVPVFDTLYQSLSDKQKKVADAEFRPFLQTPRPRMSR